MSDDRPAVSVPSPQADGYSNDPVLIIASCTVRGTYWQACVAGHKSPFGQGKDQVQAVDDLLRILTDPPERYRVEVRIDPAE